MRRVTRFALWTALWVGLCLPGRTWARVVAIMQGHFTFVK